MLADVVRILDDIQIAWRAATRDTPGGRTSNVIEVLHGDRAVWIFQEGPLLRVAFPIDIPAADADALAASGRQDEVLSSLSDLLLEGRAGYRYVFDEEHDPPLLRNVFVTERLLLRSADEGPGQRFLDALQEVVNAGLLCESALSGAFATFDAAQPGSDPGPMFQ